MATDLGSGSLEAETITNIGKRAEDRADRSFAAPDLVEVFAVSERRWQPQLVEAGAAAHDEFVAEQGMAGDLDHELAQDEVLFDVVERRPWRFRGPGDDVGLRDHQSGSIDVLMSRRQRASRVPCAGLCGSSSVVGACATRRAVRPSIEREFASRSL